MSKVIILADIQGKNTTKNTRSIVRLSKDKKYKAIFVAGDMQDTEKILGILNKASVPVYYVLGNDDLDSPSYKKFTNCKNIDKKTVKIDKYAVFGWGCAGAGSETEESAGTYKKLSKAVKGEIKRILLAHYPPRGILDISTLSGQRTRIGSKLIKKFLEQHEFDIMFCGHVHREGTGRAKHNGCKIYNVAGLGNHLTFKTNGDMYAILDMRTDKVSFGYVNLKKARTTEEAVKKTNPEIFSEEFDKQFEDYENYKADW